MGKTRDGIMTQKSKLLTFFIYNTHNCVSTFFFLHHAHSHSWEDTHFFFCPCYPISLWHCPRTSSRVLGRHGNLFINGDKSSGGTDRAQVSYHLHDNGVLAYVSSNFYRHGALYRLNMTWTPPPLNSRPAIVHEPHLEPYFSTLYLKQLRRRDKAISVCHLEYMHYKAHVITSLDCYVRVSSKILLEVIYPL